MSGIEVTTVVAADPETAFRAFTEQIDVWWKQGPRFRVHSERRSTMVLESHVGGRFLELYEGDDAFEHGRVRVWEPAQRVVFEMRGRDFQPGERTEVDVRFEPVAGGTRITVCHSGWDALAPEHPVRHGHQGEAFTSVIGLWWADQLTAVRSLVG